MTSRTDERRDDPAPARVETRRGNPSSVATPQARVREWTGSVGAVVERAAELSGGFQRRRGDASGGGARAEAEPEDSVRLGMAAAAPAGVATEKRPAAPAWLSVTEPRLRSRLLYPNPVCLLTTWGEVDGSWRKNVMTISWLTCLNNDADVLLSINARRHSAAAVLSGRAFGLSVPTSDLANMVLKIGACSGSKHDKLATVEGLAAVEADEAKAGKGGFAALMSDSSDDDEGVAAPPDAPWFVEGCVARLACVVERRLTEGEDHHVVVAKVTDASVREDYWDGKTFRAPHGRAPFLSFLGSQSFGHTVQST